eukprot:TRINITY_DN4334_c0_g1_i4.p1 TRINITY_DN4334_c0_g1~~TRINITY_DN4334_c0_g1_i4.p1  ORF type:complete len:672 (+),score=145.76 TRINITY_DN4334_c0_g1_i4:1902-3917(+)
MAKRVFHLFQPIKPMLAGKKRAEEVREMFSGEAEFLIETKYDGERIQCHFNNDSLRFFSRNSNDYTNIYGKKLSEVVRENVSAMAAILDGEVIVVNKHTGEQVQFGMNKTVALENSGDDTLQLCYKVFDVLYVKGFRGEEAKLIETPLSDRKRILQRIISNKRNLIEYVEGKRTTSADDIFSEFDKAIARNEEGIIVKRLDSVYEPNERSNAWIKLKGDYIEGMTDTLDLLIVGGYFGEGRTRIGMGDWSEHITHFLCALAKKVDLGRPSSSLYVPFCKVGTGYSVAELAALRSKLRSHWRPQKGGFITDWSPSLNDKPDCYVDDPSNSVLLEVKAAEIIKANSFPTEYTLRFPRVVKVRYDKDWNEGMTLGDLHKMIDNAHYTKNLKRKKRDDPLGDEPEEERQRRRRGMRNDGRRMRVYAEFADTDSSRVVRESNIFEECEFYVLNSDDASKSFLEELIVRHGGTKVQNYLATTTHFIAQKEDLRVRALIEKAGVNVLRPSWVIDSVSHRRQMPFAPRYILFAVEWLQKELQENYDNCGDSYFEEITDEGLEQIFTEMRLDEDSIKRDPELSNLRRKFEQLCRLDDAPRSGQTYYIFEAERSTETKLARARIVSEGGEIVSKLVGSVDYIIDANFAPEQRRLVLRYLTANPRTHLVTVDELFSGIKREE